MGLMNYIYKKNFSSTQTVWLNKFLSIFFSPRVENKDTEAENIPPGGSMFDFK